MAGLDIEGAARATSRGVDAKIIIRIDHTALTRGHTIDGETCEIAGIGPVPVAIVRSMIEDADPFIAAIVTKGRDVAAVAHLGRRPTVHQLTALDWAQPCCSVEGCDTTVGLQIDHAEDWAATNVTFLPWLDRLCGPDHHKKTHQGWALIDGTGRRAFVPPDDPRHPKHSLSSAAS